jgi:hypothetical protein
MIVGKGATQTLIPESFTYVPAKSSIVMGNFGGKLMMEVPFSDASLPVKTTFGSPQQKTHQTRGNTVGVILDEMDQRYVWTASILSDKSPLNDLSDFYQCGVEHVSIDPSATSQLFDFSDIVAATKNPCIFNDLVVDYKAKKLYVSDWGGFRIFQIDLKSGGKGKCPGCSQLKVQNPELLCSKSARTATGCAVPSTQNIGNGPNGITIVYDVNGKALLMTVVQDNVFKGYNPSTLVKMEVDAASTAGVPISVLPPGKSSPVQGYYGADGLRAWPKQSNNTLVAAMWDNLGGVGGAMGLFSTVDNWKTYTINNIYNATCPLGQMTAVTMVSERKIAGLCGVGFNPSAENEIKIFGTGFDVFRSTTMYPLETIDTSNITNPRLSYNPDTNSLLLTSVTSPTASQTKGGLWSIPSFDGSWMRARLTYTDTNLTQIISGVGIDNAYSTVNVFYCHTCMAFVSVGGLVSVKYTPPNNLAPSPTSFTNGGKTAGLFQINTCANTVVKKVWFDWPSCPTAITKVIVDGKGVLVVTDPCMNKLYKFTMTNGMLDSQYTTVPVTTMPVSAVTPMPSSGAVEPYAIIFAGSPSVPMKFVPKTNSFSVVTLPITGTALTGLAGCHMNKNGNIMYCLHNTNHVTAITSCDDWMSVKLLAVINAGCSSNSNANALTLVPRRSIFNPSNSQNIPNVVNGYYVEDLVSVCVNGTTQFATGLNRLWDINMAVTGGNPVCSATTAQPLSLELGTAGTYALGALAAVDIAAIAGSFLYSSFFNSTASK